MDNSRPIGIISTGSYLPATVVDNDEIAERAGVSAEWIERKTCIRRRHRAAPHEATSDLAAAAALRAIEQAGLTPGQISYLVVATSTPDHPQPATAAIVQGRIGARHAAAFDVNSVCSGFLFAMTAAERMLRAEPSTGAGPYAVVIGADVYSRILDYSDRKTAILFGDGAGAVVLGPVPSRVGGITTSLVTRGEQHRLISVPAGGSRRPASSTTLAQGAHYFTMDGRGVREFVHGNLPGAVHELLVKAGVPGREVRHFVPHQANGVMLAEVWPELGLEAAGLHLTLAEHGNTGAASVPVALDEVHRRGLLAEGDLTVLSAFGGGMSVGSALLRWAPTRYAMPARDRAASAASAPAWTPVAEQREPALALAGSR
ncbi:3-oxoacyl-(acyl-carrier-protein) synthase III [Kitasatospora sp. GAS204A]|uniref:3-oxoacyl-ACP synthase III family protein n=1 Tax=unclassified Kitasatospora TaxID=2633591 RepID=UPI0024768941|nr:beta-ketoacyl-ACP synthase 3 [Kitasatospora sp. GAS204B]MDH6117043.1 3-oxoacyl-(acyl-carrier-protein) synthase III [Kitasatospora sp. GAS204B]